MSKGSGGPEESWRVQVCGKEGSRVHDRGAKESTYSRNGSGEAGRNLEGLPGDWRLSKGSGGEKRARRPNSVEKRGPECTRRVLSCLHSQEMPLGKKEEIWRG